MNDVEDEIEKLRMKKVELVGRMNIATDFDEKEELQQQVERLQDQIDTLERFRKKSSTGIHPKN